MSNDLKNVKSLAILVATITFTIILFDWLYYVQILEIPIKKGLFEKIGLKFVYIFHKFLILIRVLFVISSGLSFYATKKIRKNKKYEPIHYIIGTICIIIFCLNGYSFYLYNLILYPILVIASVIAAYIIISFTQEHLEDQNIFGLSKKGKSNEVSYKLKVKKEKQIDYLEIHSSHQHIYIQGGSGCGKGDSIIHPLIYQSVDMHLPGVIYSYKGHRSKLVKTAYLAYYNNIKLGKDPIAQLKLFNFSDMSRSYRANPISPKYITSSAHAKTIATVIALSLNKDWIKKLDDWGKWAIAIIHATIWKLADDHPNLCSLPFLVEILYSDNVEAIINFIESNDEAKKIFRPVSLAKDGSIKQFTGILTTTLTGFTGLISKNMYWLLSADEINFDVTNSINPELLVLCNDEEVEETASPVLSAMFSILMKMTNQPGKLEGFMSIDEIYTLYIHKLDKYANTVRENGMSIHIGNQEISMLYDLWGIDKGDNVRGACGNQFYGMAGTEKSAKIPVEILSSIDKVNWSYSDSSESNSQSETLKEKKAVQIRDVMGLNTGEFLGKIANGKPPYFKEQFMLFEHSKTLDQVEIPPFVLDEYTEEELELAIELNYKEIQDKTKKLLEPYIPIEQPEENPEE